MLDVLRKCLNWKVVTGLIAVGLGVWVVAPGAIGAALPFLVLLACPLSMLVMMGAMGRQMRLPAQDGGRERGLSSLVAERDQIDAEITALSTQDERSSQD